MFKQIIEPINPASTNVFSSLADITADVSKYQNSCYHIYETGSSDLSGGFLQAAFQNVQDELTNTNDFYLAAGIITNFKAVGYQFSNQQSATGKMYCYFVIQDFQQVRNTPIIY